MTFTLTVDPVKLNGAAWRDRLMVRLNSEGQPVANASGALSDSYWTLGPDEADPDGVYRLQLPSIGELVGDPGYFVRFGRNMSYVPLEPLPAGSVISLADFIDLPDSDPSDLQLAALRRADMVLAERLTALEELGPGSGGPGTPGANGKSAYELALTTGFTGSLTDWLAFLRGPKGDSGPASTIPGPRGEKGDKGEDSTVPGPKGEDSTVPGPKGADSTVPGPKGDKGDKGADSTVPGPKGDKGADSTVPGPKGDKGDAGAASTVPGPKGDTGAASTVPGPKGDKGDTGAASTVPGPKGDTGAASTVPGPKGDKGDTGAASTVPGPKGDKGDTGAVSTVPGPKGDTGAASTVPGPKGDKGDTGPAGTTTVDGLTDATTIGKSLAKASTKTVARDAIDAANASDVLTLAHPVATGFTAAAGVVPIGVTSSLSGAGPYSDPDPLATLTGPVWPAFAVRNTGTVPIDFNWRQIDGTVRTSKLLPGEIRMFRQESTLGYAPMPGFIPLSQFNLLYASPLTKPNVPPASSSYVIPAPAAMVGTVSVLGLSESTGVGTTITLPKGVAAGDGSAEFRLQLYLVNNGGGNRPITVKNTDGVAAGWDNNGPSTVGTTDGNTVLIEAVTLNGGTTYTLSGPIAGLALGETQGTAYDGKKGKDTADSLTAHAADKINPHGVTVAQIQGTTAATKVYTVADADAKFVAGTDPRLQGRTLVVGTGRFLPPTGITSTSAPVCASGSAFFQPLDVVGVQAFNLLSCNAPVARVGGTATVYLAVWGSLADGTGPDLSQLLASGQVDLLTANTSSVTLGPAVFSITGRVWTMFLYVATAAPTTVPTITSKSGGLPVFGSTGFGLGIGAVITGLTGMPTSADQGNVASHPNPVPIVSMKRSA